MNPSPGTEPACLEGMLNKLFANGRFGKEKDGPGWCDSNLSASAGGAGSESCRDVDAVAILTL